MGRCSCCVLALIFIVIVVADVLLFAYLMGTFDPQEVKLTTSDMIKIDNLSNFWCDGVTLESSLKFNAYKLESQPIMRDNYHQKYSYSFATSLSTLGYSLYSLYLLQDSSLKISVCSSEPTAVVTVFNSEEDLNSCLSRRSNLDWDDRDYDDFDDLQCRNNMLNSKIMVESDCESSRWTWWRNRRKGMDVANINAYNDAYYNILIQNFYPRGQNKIRVQLNVSRTIYDVRGSPSNCLETSKCYLGLDFWSGDTIVAQMLPLTTTNKLVPTTLHYKCDLNEIILIGMFLVLPLAIFLISCCIVCCCCRKKKVKHEVHIIKGEDKKALLGPHSYNADDDNSVFMPDIEPKNYGATNNYQYAPSSQPSNIPNPSAPMYYPPAPPPSYNNVPPQLPNSSAPMPPPLPYGNAPPQPNDPDLPPYMMIPPKNPGPPYP